MLKIPVIDFEPFIQADNEKKQAVVREIYHACHEIGFIQLKNVGISPNCIEQTFTEMQQFFALPLVEKKQLAWSDKISNRGYIGIEKERLAPDKPGDLKEAFNVGKEIKDENSDFLSHNHWPQGKEKFRQIVLDFYQACTEAAKIIYQAFALALQLPESFFCDNHNQQNHTLRLLHYPPLNQSPKPGQVRAGEHTDYGSFTLLFQDEVEGLEIYTAEGAWIAAPYIPGTIIVNTGDLMQRWTNNVFCSTKHRVMIPTDERVKLSRYSAAFFCHPNNDTEITCLKSCQSSNLPQLYPTITAGEYLLSRLEATY